MSRAGIFAYGLIGYAIFFTVFLYATARPAFKRSTHVLFSSLVLLALFTYWEPIGGEIWSVTDSTARTAVLALYGFGWLQVWRRPRYIGWLIIFWVTPVMTVAHLVFALMTSAYILIAIQLDERDRMPTFDDDARIQDSPMRT